MTMRPLTFFIQPIEKLTLRDAMNLQRNRLEGTKYKPRDQMSWMEKAFEKGSLMRFYKLPYFKSKCHKAHIFPTEDRYGVEHHVVVDG